MSPCRPVLAKLWHSMPTWSRDHNSQ